MVGFQDDQSVWRCLNGNWFSQTLNRKDNFHFLFDKNRKLVYRGQFDDSRPGNGKPITGADLSAACDAMLAGRPVSEKQKASIGCNIKWRSDNAPAYFTGVAAQ